MHYLETRNICQKKQIRFILRIHFIGLWLCAVIFSAPEASAQVAQIQYGEGVPAIVRIISERGLQFIAQSQQEDGSWGGSQAGSGITGICVMAMMSSGEDPDFGPYSENIRKALRHIILFQDGDTGLATGPGHGPMYHHGFATLALSEAYGVVNERLLWQNTETPVEERRSIGQALELAVRCILTAQQKNPYNAWRYSPDGTDADTTVSGTVLMGLLGARNAGIEVPNEAVENAIAYFHANTLRDGNVTYQLAQSQGDGITRAAIATLVYSIAKRKDTDEFKATSDFIKKRVDQDVNDYPFYYRYYMAQALFQSDLELWKAWNQRTAEFFQNIQAEDGSFQSSHGRAYATGMAVLSMALNYRLLPVYER